MKIPDSTQIKALWDKYDLPEYKRIHVTLVAKVAKFLATKVISKTSDTNINIDLLFAAALLHDIDKNISKLPGERHPDTGVRILKEEGMEEIADIVKTHSLHMILDPKTAPKTWEQKLLFLADKMVKHEIITVDERFQLWRDENLPAEAVKELDAAYPLVKKLESDIVGRIGVMPEKIASLA